MKDKAKKVEEQLSSLSPEELENLGDVIEDLKDDGIINNSVDDNNEPKQQPEKVVIQKETVKKKGGALKLILLAIIVLVIAGVVVFIFFRPKASIKISSSVLLEDIKDISELASGRYTYNAVATKYDEEGAAKYHVLYDGYVDMGFDVEDLEIKESNKTITITVPEVKVLTTDVFIKPENYIFLDSKYQTETVAAEAEQLCKEDILKRAQEDQELITIAQNNAKDSVEAMVEPFVSQLSGYTVVIK